MPTYPDPNPEVTQNKLAILALLQAIPYLDPTRGGTLTAVNDPKLALKWIKYTPPAMVLAFRGSVLEHAQSKEQDAALFEEQFQWALFVIAGNYDVSGTGVGELFPGDPGVEAMISDARAALYGRQTMQVPRVVKVMPVNPPIEALPLEEERVVYRLNFRTNWLIHGPVP